MKIVQTGLGGTAAVPSKADHMAAEMDELEKGSNVPEFEHSLAEQMAKVRAKREARMLRRHNLIHRRLKAMNDAGLNQQASNADGSEVSRDV